MNISVRMITISFWMGFRHVHFCTNDYPFLFEWIFVLHIPVRMTTISFWIDCRHAHFCKNDYPFLFEWIVVMHFLYEWLLFLFEWLSVMHISVRMTTIYFWFDFRHAHFCTNEYHFFFIGLSSCAFLFERTPFLFILVFVMHILCQWLSIVFVYEFRQAHFGANDFPYSFRFSCVQCSQRVNSIVQ